MQSLLTHISAFTDKTALQAAQQTVSYLQLEEQALQLRRQYPQLQGRAVAIRYTDLPVFISALLAFDGWCSELYLLPTEDAPVVENAVLWPPDGDLSLPAANAISHSRWYLATSGTTGTPKWIEHNLLSLCRTIKTTEQAAGLRWGLCYQPFRFAGLQVLLQSLLSSATLVDASSGDAEQRLQTLITHQVNAISATPSFWRQLLMTGQLTQLPLTQLTLGGEIADQALLEQLSVIFPQSKLLHIYASTELGSGFAVTDKQAGFPVDWLKHGHGGLYFKIDQQQHLWIKPAISPGSDLTKQLDQDGYLDTQDLVTQQAERVIFLGRASGVINVGGNKVHPEYIEQILLQIKGVQQARVYGKSSSILGQLVVADLVAAEGFQPHNLQKSIVEHCQKQLQRYQIPTRLNWVTAISTESTGKISRNRQYV